MAEPLSVLSSARATAIRLAEFALSGGIMTVEGMWQFQSGDLGNPTFLQWGGIVVLESGRVMGGDSHIAYLGSYETAQGSVRATVRTWTWNTDVPPGHNVFGIPTTLMTRESPLVVMLQGNIDGSVIAGFLNAVGAPDQKLFARMTKIAELP